MGREKDRGIFIYFVKFKGKSLIFCFRDHKNISILQLGERTTQRTERQHLPVAEGILPIDQDNVDIPAQTPMLESVIEDEEKIRIIPPRLLHGKETSLIPVGRFHHRDIL